MERRGRGTKGGEGGGLAEVMKGVKRRQEAQRVAARGRRRRVWGTWGTEDAARSLRGRIREEIDQEKCQAI